MRTFYEWAIIPPATLVAIIIAAGLSMLGLAAGVGAGLLLYWTVLKDSKSKLRKVAAMGLGVLAFLYVSLVFYEAAERVSKEVFKMRATD